MGKGEEYSKLEIVPCSKTKVDSFDRRTKHAQFVSMTNMH